MNESNSIRFSDVVRFALTTAGWFPGRQVEENMVRWTKQLVNKGGFEMFPAARDVLLEFGGLKINQQGPGEECARGSIDLNPLLAVYMEDLFAEYASLLGKKLLPLGEAFDGHTFLAISESGRVFLIMHDIWLVGENFDDALECLIRGLNAIPLNNPDQQP